MAIIVSTRNPNTIVNNIRKRIDEEMIDTWIYDDDGDFTHTGQWKNKAWMRPIFDSENSTVTFAILGRKNVEMTLMEYSIYHGRFLEMLINNFPKEIISVKITPPLDNLNDYNRISF